jgi:hypothetical protein
MGRKRDIPAAGGSHFLNMECIKHRLKILAYAFWRDFDSVTWKYEEPRARING